LGGFHCIPVTGDLAFQAMDISILNKISGWDSLIVAAAVSGGCGVILSEDMRDGQKISGVTVENPFS